VRRCLLHGITCGDALTGLLSALQAERSGRREPIGQDREGLPAGMTDPAPPPSVFVLVMIVWVVANRTSPWQEVQRNYPGSMVSFASGSAIKRITAGVKVGR
jgi:hypothetical protein